MLTPRPFSLTMFPNEEGYDESSWPGTCRSTRCASTTCSPSTGVAHVGYLPGDRILGLSKLARVVELFARACRCRSA